MEFPRRVDCAADEDRETVLRPGGGPAGHVEPVFDEHVVEFAEQVAVQPYLADRVGAFEHKFEPFARLRLRRAEAGPVLEVDELPDPQPGGIESEIRVRHDSGPVQVRDHIARNLRRNRHRLPGLRVCESEGPTPFQYLSHRRLRLLQMVVFLFCAKYRLSIVYPGKTVNQAGNGTFKRLFCAK